MKQTDEWYSRFYRTGNAEGFFDVSDSWINVKKSYEYFSQDTYSNGQYKADTTAPEGVQYDQYTQQVIHDIIAQGVQPGDLIYFVSRDEATGEIIFKHAAMISSVTETEIGFTGNTTRRFDRDLSLAFDPEEYSGIWIVKLNDTLPAD